MGLLRKSRRDEFSAFANGNSGKSSDGPPLGNLTEFRRHFTITHINALDTFTKEDTRAFLKK
jgi:hypothetical protein